VKSRDCKRILVRGPNWMGDLVMATPVFARIRASFPDAHITCGLRPNLLPLLSNTPFFDAFLEMPQSKGLRRWPSFWAQVRTVRRGGYQLAIVLPNSLSSGWIMKLAGVPHRLGYRQGRPFTMNLGLTAEKNRGVFQRRHGPRRVPTPMPEYWGKLLDVMELPPRSADPSLHTSDAENAWIDAWLTDHGIDPQARIVLLNAGANYGPSKLWVADRWVELARHYRSNSAEPIFLAGPNETEMVAEIAAQAGAQWAFVPLDKLKALVGRSRLVVSTDTGPRHLALGMRVPTVCLMGPNDPRYTNYALDRQVVLQKDLECVPCQMKICPLGHQNCMKEITVGDVIEAADGLIERLSGLESQREAR
jgi:heptosyltransferase-2